MEILKRGLVGVRGGWWVGALVLTALLAGVFVFTPRESHAESDRVVTVFYDGLEKTVVTDATNVEGVLRRAGISLGTHDAVEPGLKTELTAPTYNINIYRARPVTIIDETKKQIITSPYTSPRTIAETAGLAIQDEDLLELTRSNDLMGDGAGLKLTIDRATPVILVLYGTQKEVHTQSVSVGDFLQEKGISLGQEDGMNVGLNASITPGVKIEVWRNGVQTLTEEKEVAFSVETIRDADKPTGFKEVKEAGKPGKKLVTYEIEMRNGFEVNRKEIQNVVTEQPKKQVEIVGIKGKVTTPLENENIIWGYLIRQGFSRAQTAGIMGNLQQENGFKTNGDGIAQWTGSRRAALYAKPDPNSIYTQLDFMMEELNGRYANVRDAIKADTSNDPTNAVRIFQNKYEKCGVCAESRRIQYAFNILASH